MKGQKLFQNYMQNPASQNSDNKDFYQENQNYEKGSPEDSPQKYQEEQSSPNQQNALDDDYQNHSSTKKQVKEGGDQMNTIAFNLSKININESTNPNNQSFQKKQDSVYVQQQQEKQKMKEEQLIDIQIFDSCYKAFLNSIATDQAFVNASYENKIASLIEFFTNQNMDYRLGSLIFLFELIYNFRDSLTDHAISLILSQLYINIPIAYENKDYYNVYSSLEIIALIGPHPISYNNIKLLASILIDDALPVLQDKAFLALINFDYPGFYALVDIANKDFNDVPLYIMNKLAQNEEIQISVIIPSLLNDINTGDAKKKVSSLSALNRMYSMIWKGGSLPLLINYLNEGSLDRQLIVSTIRACGEIGEQTLLKIAKQTTNPKIKLAISTVLSWRIKQNPKNALKINIVSYQVSMHYNVNPGTMCVYFGNQTPLAFIDEEDDEQALQEDYIEINSRDYMAALQRLLAVKYEKFQNSEEGISKKHDITSQIHEFTLANLIDPTIAQEDEEEPQISSNVIKVLCQLTTDKNNQVREAAINTLGIIGLPEANEAVEFLYKALFDSDSQIRSMAGWCCGRLGDLIPEKIAKKLIELLKDPYWKVRTAACVAIGSIGPNLSEMALSPLAKILKDNTINKLTICETLVRLGVYGEQILIDLLKNVPQTNFKLKSAIIQSFQLANVQRPTIDFIIEELFKNANDSMLQVRKACLQTLEVLRNRALDSSITYLKSKNIIPLFYYFLQDPSAEIREMAMLCIRSFGPQAELIFIEGLTKDKNALIRCECARGLASLGVQNFRALLFGLRDAEEQVRKITAQSIRQSYNVDQIIQEYEQKQNQVPALLCNIKDILCLPFMIHDKTRKMLQQILYAFGETVQNEPKIVDYPNPQPVQNYRNYGPRIESQIENPLQYLQQAQQWYFNKNNYFLENF